MMWLMYKNFDLWCDQASKMSKIFICFDIIDLCHEKPVFGGFRSGQNKPGCEQAI